MLILIVMTLGAESPNYQGRIGNLAMIGEFTLASVVILVNLKIFTSQNTLDCGAFLWNIGSVLLFIGSWAALSFFAVDSSTFGSFLMVLVFPEVYFTLLIVTFAYIMIDFGLRHTNLFLIQWTRRRRQRDKQRAKAQDKLDETLVRQKISVYRPTQRGYAFSGEAGQDRLITDKFNLSYKIASRLFGENIVGSKSEFLQKRPAPKVKKTWD